MRSISAGIVFLLLAGSVQAEPQTEKRITAQEFITKIREGNTHYFIYSNGLVSGIQSGFSYFYMRTKKNIYCPPKSYRLHPENLADVMSNYLEKNPIVRTEPADIVAIFALVEEFPCSADSKK